MKCPLLCFILFFSFCFSTGYAQEKNYDISEPIDLPQTGVNKVLCMKNGNTMVFHFEPNKDIVTKIFDSSHKDLSSKKILCRVLDIAKIGDDVFKGLFEINGEAVLFIEQEHLSKHGLIMLRFNAADGTLIEEKLVGESKGVSKQTTFYVMKDKNEDSYAILFCTDVPQFQECSVYVAYYNNKHENVKQVPIEVDRKKYDYLEVVGTERQPNGISITLSLFKLIENGIAGGGISDAAIYDHHLAVYYIPKDSSTAYATGVHLSTETYPFYSNYTYNPFARTLNLLLLSYKEIRYKYGLEFQPAAMIQHLFFKIDESSMAVDYKWMKYASANKFLKEKTDSGAFYEGLPINMYTNENGLSTMISESFSRYWEPESRVRNDLYTDFGLISITQFDDDGNEIWSSVLPLRQRFKSYKHFYAPYELSKRWQTQGLFGDLPDAVYERQFISINTYNRDNNFYIVFNDNDKNFNNSIEHPGDTVYGFNTTNACYYKMGRKKEITKHYLYGTPDANEYKSSFIEGADFDEKRGVYASLIQYKKGDDVSLRMAWSKLD